MEGISIDGLPDRVRSKIRVDEERGCWIWTGRKLKLTSGLVYGVTTQDGHCFLIHRLVWELLVDRIPVGLILDHQCELKICCNPRHLKVTTRRINTIRGVNRDNDLFLQIYPCGHPRDLDNTYLSYVKGQARRRCKLCFHQLWKNRREKDRSMRRLSGPSI